MVAIEKRERQKLSDSLLFARRANQGERALLEKSLRTRIMQASVSPTLDNLTRCAWLEKLLNDHEQDLSRLFGELVLPQLKAYKSIINHERGQATAKADGRFCSWDAANGQSGISYLPGDLHIASHVILTSRSQRSKKEDKHAPAKKVSRY